MDLLICSNIYGGVIDFENMDTRKTQRSKYLENETFLLQIKKFVHYTSTTIIY